MSENLALVAYDFFRRCYVCDTKIRACFGYTHAGDFVRAMEGEQTRVRELCGRCVLGVEKYLFPESVRDLLHSRVLLGQ